MTLTLTELKNYERNDELMSAIGLTRDNSYVEIYYGVVALIQKVVDDEFAKYGAVAPKIV